MAFTTQEAAAAHLIPLPNPSLPLAFLIARTFECSIEDVFSAEGVL